MNILRKATKINKMPKNNRSMSIFKKIKNFFRKLFCKKEKEPVVVPPVETTKYELVYEDKFNGDLSDFWKIVKTRYSSWCKYAGSSPKHHYENGENFFRFPVTYYDETYHTAAIKSADSYGDGKMEVVARFKGGKATWPAIWMTHPNGSANNYENYFEIDLSEYYETRDDTDTTYHCPESMRDSTKRQPSVKTKINAYDWNKFTCTWDDEALRVFINDKKIWEFKNNGNPDQYPLLYDQRDFSIILSMQYGSKWLSEEDKDELPLWMDIKSFKLWKKV